MAVYGYSKRVANECGLHEMSEVTFDVPLEHLRRVAAFLIACANQAESGEWQSSHWHMTEYDEKWDHDHPDCDVIVIHPAPDPPKLVG